MSKLVIYCEDADFTQLSAAFEGEFISDCPLSAEIIFVDDNRIQSLNARTRGVDKVTDVLSYPSLEGIKGRDIKKADFPFDADETGALFLGSVAICKSVAKLQAEEYGHSEEREINYLAVHGICHLLGYDHIEEQDRAEMRKKEERVLKRMGLERV